MEIAILWHYIVEQIAGRVLKIKIKNFRQWRFPRVRLRVARNAIIAKSSLKSAGGLRNSR